MSKNKVSYSFSQENSQLKVARVDPAHLSLKTLDSVDQTRVPLSQVVSDCVKRWFQDTLKEAKAGDSAMRLLVGQMYNSGYGVNKDTETEEHKAIGSCLDTKALKSRSSAFKSRAINSQLPSDHFSLQYRQSSGFFDCPPDYFYEILPNASAHAIEVRLDKHGLLFD
ncbi:hypothetical protein Cgig2_025408 [Carnegiea gigantea]|uniref:Uncharacterized protein n=1 Tax=Carnegiea gigantea TaxID=171969 RepID=A0A9Q1K0D3_9CARY|nr:hypothetical protein Cgig2_025408 [Carnegiea gigantea]